MLAGGYNLHVVFFPDYGKILVNFKVETNTMFAFVNVCLCMVYSSERARWDACIHHAGRPLTHPKLRSC